MMANQLDELATTAVKHEAEFAQKKPSKAGKKSKSRAKKAKKLEMRIMKLTVIDTLNVYEQPTASSAMTAEPLYRVAFATLPNSNQLYTVFDRKFKINKGYCEIAIKPASKNFKTKLEESGTWQIQGMLTIPTMPFDVKKAIGTVNWKKTLEFLVDDTGKKAESLKDIAKSCLINQTEQNIQPNGIILTNSGSGKSTTFRNMTGNEPATNVSEAGLIGSVIKSEKGGWETTVGFLDGGGLAVFDEFPEYDYAVVNKLLSYLESGKTSRILVRDVRCEGSKTVIFLGNFDKLSESDFVKSIVGLATEKTLERVGRRFGHVIFNELPEINNEIELEESAFFETRNLVRYAIEFAEDSIKKIFKTERKWIGEQDNDYIAQVGEVASLCQNELVRNFLHGCQRQSPRLKCSAVKRAIIENLDRIILEPNLNEVYAKYVKPDIAIFYDKFKQYNLDSFYNFRYDKLVFFRKNWHEGMTSEELDTLARKIGVATRTLYRWMKIPPAKNVKEWSGDSKEEKKPEEGSWKNTS